MYEHFEHTKRGIQAPCSIRVRSHNYQSHREYIYRKMQRYMSVSAAG